jgi:hypothetical protein
MPGEKHFSQIMVGMGLFCFMFVVCILAGVLPSQKLDNRALPFTLIVGTLAIFEGIMHEVIKKYRKFIWLSILGDLLFVMCLVLVYFNLV